MSALFSAKRDFPSAWHVFLHSADASDDQRLTLALIQERFPWLSQAKTLTIDKIKLLVKINPAFAATYNATILRLTFAAEGATLSEPDLIPGTRWPYVLYAEKSKE